MARNINRKVTTGVLLSLSLWTTVAFSLATLLGIADVPAWLIALPMCMVWGGLLVVAAWPDKKQDWIIDGQHD